MRFNALLFYKKCCVSIAVTRCDSQSLHNSVPARPLSPPSLENKYHRGPFISLHRKDVLTRTLKIDFSPITVDQLIFQHSLAVKKKFLLQYDHQLSENMKAAMVQIVKRSELAKHLPLFLIHLTPLLSLEFLRYKMRG